eukprot:TRINITY_DN15602_c0_g1_i1.p1 TRINITY_DN15602_c0_g1~~TRINITY_DN15602_c0_g1_i1.p1  ORF type:complete len:192 (+),score=54.97 TRINITY_DN15602_c0_g1_i1:73-648(+)
MVNPEFSISAKEGVSKSVFYSNLLSEAKSLISNEVDLIANTSNLSSLIYHGLNERDANAKVNWAGFYFMRKKGEKPSELVLGPFQGQVACIRIAVGRGVCGTTVKNQTTTVVPDVHQFPGHIACDSKSLSEIVVPIMIKNPSNQEEKICIGVLDIDSAALSTFDEEDKNGLEAVVQALIESETDWSQLIKG